MSWTRRHEVPLHWGDSRPKEAWQSGPREGHGAGFIAERDRVQGLPVRAERSEPWTRGLKSKSSRLPAARRVARYNGGDESHLTFARIIMRVNRSGACALGHFCFGEPRWIGTGDREKRVAR